MGFKKQDPMVEPLKRILQFGDGSGAAMADLPPGASSADLEALFLAELRSRRERLARWMQWIQEEVGMDAAPARPRSHRGHQCRSREGRSRFGRGR